MSYYNSRNQGATLTLPGQPPSSLSNNNNNGGNGNNTNLYDFSPLSNQIHPNLSNSAGNGGFLNNNNNNNNSNSSNNNNTNSANQPNGFGYTNSPLSNNSVLNSSQSNGFNNLNLSTRSNNLNSSIYPTPRLTNISPNLNFASLYSNRARLNASKGFELEDDLEFCPDIQLNGNNLNGSFTHHKFNPYTSSTFSPQVSPTSGNASTVSPVSNKIGNNNNHKNNVTTTPSNNNTSGLNESPRTITPRAKKVLEIVNPITGLRVSSPTPYN